MNTLVIKAQGRPWKIYTNPRDAWAAMLDDCAAARGTIDLESYIFEYDEIGKQFLELLKKKAQEGVRVRVLFDMVGSFALFRTSTLLEEFSRGGVKIRFFNPIRPWRIRRFFSWIRRDHRKLLVIDSRIGYTGSLNIAWRMRDWRETHMRVDDGIVLDFERMFEHMWAAAKEKRFMWAPKTPPALSLFSLLTSAPQLRRRYMYRFLLKAVRGARRSIYITTPYFIPSVNFFDALRGAARRGVDVRLLLPLRSDVPIVDIAAGAYIAFLLKSGIRIFRYAGKALHVKTAIVDDSWATLGSTNLDNISLFFNYELNLASTDPAFAMELKNHFVRDIGEAEEMFVDAWISRPWHRKVLEALLLPFHKIL